MDLIRKFGKLDQVFNLMGQKIVLSQYKAMKKLVVVSVVKFLTIIMV